MADRDALREFQARLAGRLQAARTTGVSASWLAVEAGEGKYLFPLGHAGEIFPWAHPQPVPYTASWFLGVVGLRGGLYGVIHFAAFLSGSKAPEPVDESTHGQARLVALNELLEVNCALMIDRLAGLRGVEAFVASEPPAVDGAPWYGHVYLDAEGVRWQEISLQALSQQDHFLSIGA